MGTEELFEKNKLQDTDWRVRNKKIWKKVLTFLWTAYNILIT